MTNRRAGITTVCDMGRPPFTGRAESAWEDLEELIVPAAEARQLPIRVVSYMPLSTWCAAPLTSLRWLQAQGQTGDCKTDRLGLICGQVQAVGDVVFAVVLG